MKTILTTVCLIIASMTASHSMGVSRQVIPSKIDSVVVYINDGARDGCWTNLGEAKRYAEDKLELAGFTVRSKEDTSTDNGYTLEIRINSGRTSSSNCYGSVNLSLYQTNFIDCVFGDFEVGYGGGVFIGHANANQLVLKYLQKFFKAFPE